MAIDGRARELLQEPNFAHVATLRKDGSIHNVPVWVDVDGDDVVLNSAEGRAWPSNLERTGKITVTVSNRENPYEYVSVTGTLADSSTADADAHIDALAKKYMGLDEYPLRQPGEVRKKFRITPERVFHFAAG
jgi:PPOX class probable F420-dependent enzyme